MNATVSNDKHLDSDYVNEETFLVMIHRMIGGAIPKLKEKFGHQKSHDGIAHKIIESMHFRIFKGTVDPNYVAKYISQILLHFNKGGSISFAKNI